MNTIVNITHFEKNRVPFCRKQLSKLLSNNWEKFVSQFFPKCFLSSECILYSKGFQLITLDYICLYHTSQINAIRKISFYFVEK